MLFPKNELVILYFVLGKLRVFKLLAIGAVGNRTYGGRMSRSGDRSYRRRNF